MPHDYLILVLDNLECKTKGPTELVKVCNEFR